MSDRLSPGRAVLLVGLVLAAGLAVLVARGLGSGSVYYFAPSELASARTEGRVIRVGGTVVPGSVRWQKAAGILRFELTDGRGRVAVANAGAPPSLFRAGRSTLVEGRLSGGTLRSSSLIVKHDANYRAPGPQRGGRR